MRNWNNYMPALDSYVKLKFIACLWGIETQFQQMVLKLTNACLSRAYEELKLGVAFKEIYQNMSVYRVPMRNWNYGYTSGNLDNSSSLSRAYEELKLYIKFAHFKPPRWFIACLWGIETNYSIALFNNTITFIACLWGIETK